MTTKTHRKPRKTYRFKTRDDAESAYMETHADSLRNYFAAIHFLKRFNLHREQYEIGIWRAELIRTHATTGNELSIGPVLVLEDRSSTCSPQIVDAWEWSREIAARDVSPSNQDAHDLRDLACKIRLALNN